MSSNCSWNFLKRNTKFGIVFEFFLDDIYEIYSKHFFRALSYFRYFYFIKSMLNTMICICPSTETPNFVLGKNWNHRFTFFVYYLFSIHGNFSKRLKLKNLSSWFTQYTECRKHSLKKNSKIFGTVRPMKIVIIPAFVEKTSIFQKHVYWLYV